MHLLEGIGTLLHMARYLVEKYVAVYQQKRIEITEKSNKIGGCDLANIAIANIANKAQHC